MKINDFEAFEYIYLLILPIFIILYYKFFFSKRRSVYNYSNIKLLTPKKKSLKLKLKLPVIVFLRTAAIIFIIIALMRPRRGQDIVESITNAVDIMITLDVSGSMQAEDFKPRNRLEAAKQVTMDFINNRKYDRIGLIQFGKGAFLKCPLTTDYNALIDFISKIDFEYTWTQTQFDFIKTPVDFHNGTYIASALGVAAYHLKESEAKSKVIILVTDGKQEGDNFDPITIVKAAAEFDIKIYTVSIGVPNKKVPFPVFYKNAGKQYIKNPDGSYPEIPVDEPLLKEIAKLTNGEFFRAADFKGLTEIFKKIDELEKTEIKVNKYVKYKEYFQIFLAVSIILLLLEFLFKNTFFKTIPEE